jgi:hypothetical protein
MRRKLLGLFLCATLTFSAAAAAFGQEEASVQKPRGYFAVRPLFGVDHETVKAAITNTATSGMIPLWTLSE